MKVLLTHLRLYTNDVFTLVLGALTNQKKINGVGEGVQAWMLGLNFFNISD